MKKYLWMSSAAVVIGALRVKYFYFSESDATEKTVRFVQNYCFPLVQFLNILELGH